MGSRECLWYKKCTEIKYNSYNNKQLLKEVRFMLLAFHVIGRTVDLLKTNNQENYYAVWN